MTTNLYTNASGGVYAATTALSTVDSQFLVPASNHIGNFSTTTIQTIDAYEATTTCISAIATVVAAAPNPNSTCKSAPYK